MSATVQDHVISQLSETAINDCVEELVTQPAEPRQPIMVSADPVGSQPSIVINTEPTEEHNESIVVSMEPAGVQESRMEPADTQAESVDCPLVDRECRPRSLSLEATQPPREESVVVRDCLLYTSPSPRDS